MEEKAVNIKKILKAVLLAVVLSFILVALLAVYVSLSDVSERVVENSIFAISSGSALLSAFILAKNAEKNGMLNGLLLGVGYFMLITIVSLTFGGKITFNMSNALRCFSVLASAMLGGVLGINSRK